VVVYLRMVSHLNWKEINHFVDHLHTKLSGLSVETVFIRENLQSESGFLKNEWVLRLSSPSSSGSLILSARPQSPYFLYYENAGFKKSKGATLSAFALSLSQHLKGLKILKIRSLPEDRFIVIDFTHQKSLVLCLIPAATHAALIETNSHLIYAHSKVNDLKKVDAYKFLEPSQSKKAFEIRSEYFNQYTRYVEDIERSLINESIQNKKQKITSYLNSSLAKLKKTEKKLKETLSHLDTDPPFKKWADYLKAELHLPHILNHKNEREVFNYENDIKMTIFCDPKLTPQAQVEKFYSRAKRHEKKLSESNSQLKSINTEILKNKKILESIPSLTGFLELEKLEKSLGLIDEKSVTLKATYPGRAFTSCDGLLILIGRNSDENLNLTFKVAKGNDVWMHLRGRPSSHTIILVPPKKTVPLTTLLEAAKLTVFFNGGREWGKTEVDYTLCKNVKKIKKTKKVSYTQNKTLNVQVDQKEIDQILNSTNDSSV